MAAEDEERVSSANEASTTGDEELEEDAPRAKEGKEEEKGKESEEQNKNEEEEETCGFCKFMKGGACKDVFVAWEQCVDSCRDEEGGDFVESCLNQTKYLKECMEENAEYYGIMLQAEEESKAAKDKATDAEASASAEAGAEANASAVANADAKTQPSSKEETVSD